MQGSGFAIRRYRSGDEHEIADLMNRAFSGSDEAVQWSAERWLWKFAGNPAGHHCLVATDPEGRIVGHYGGVPQFVRSPMGRVRFGQNCDTCSDPRVRRGLRNPGLFVRLAQAYASTYGVPGMDAVMYGLPNRRVFRVGNKFLDYWMLRTQYALVVASDAEFPPWDDGVQIDHLEEFPEDVDDFFERVAGQYGCIAERTKAVLDWRFSHHPDVTHRIGVARAHGGGPVRGYAVLRTGDVLGRKTALLVDWLVDESDEVTAGNLVRWAAWAAAQEGENEVVFVTATSSSWFERFQSFGFIVEPTAYTMTARPYDTRFAPDWLRRNWYYTLADFDIV